MFGTVSSIIRRTSSCPTKFPIIGHVDHNRLIRIDGSRSRIHNDGRHQYTGSGKIKLLLVAPVIVLSGSFEPSNETVTRSQLYTRSLECLHNQRSLSDSTIAIALSAVDAIHIKKLRKINFKEEWFIFIMDSHVP